MASDGKLPERLARLNPRSHSPNNALIAQMIWTLILVWSGTYDALYTYVIFAGFLFYGLAALAILKLRRGPAGDDVYLTPFHPVLPGLHVLFVVAFCANAITERPVESLAGLLIVGLGLPAYYWFTRQSVARSPAADEAP